MEICSVVGFPARLSVKPPSPELNNFSLVPIYRIDGERSQDTRQYAGRSSDRTWQIGLPFMSFSEKIVGRHDGTVRGEKVLSG